MGKSTISMAISNIYVKLPEANSKNPLRIGECGSQLKRLWIQPTTTNYGFIIVNLYYNDYLWLNNIMILSIVNLYKYNMVIMIYIFI